MTIKKFQELEDNQLRNLDLLDTRKAYVELREHHIDETTKLYAKIAALRAENQKMGGLLQENVYKTLIETLVSPALATALEPNKIIQNALSELIPKSGRSNSAGTNYKCDLTRHTCPGCPVHD